MRARLHTRQRARRATRRDTKPRRHHRDRRRGFHHRRRRTPTSNTHHIRHRPFAGLHPDRELQDQRITRRDDPTIRAAHIPRPRQPTILAEPPRLRYATIGHDQLVFAAGARQPFKTPRNFIGDRHRPFTRPPTCVRHKHHIPIPPSIPTRPKHRRTRNRTNRPPRTRPPRKSRHNQTPNHHQHHTPPTPRTPPRHPQHARREPLASCQPKMLMSPTSAHEPTPSHEPTSSPSLQAHSAYAPAVHTPPAYPSSGPYDTPVTPPPTVPPAPPPPTSSQPPAVLQERSSA